MLYATACHNDDKCFTKLYDQRMKFVKVDGDWKISPGM